MVSQQTEHICWGAGHEHCCTHSLEVRDLQVNYGPVRALEGVSFTASCGHTLALVGPNGAGKSTLLSALAGLLTPQAGSMCWMGTPLRQCKHEIAYLPQRSEVDWSFPITVRQLVEMGCYPSLGMWKSFGAHETQIVQRALESMQLTDLAGRQIAALSGGQQQRAFLARALAQEAHILLLDEPFTGLDVPSSEILAALLRQLAGEGRLVIASHHDLNTAPRIFDQCLLLHRTAIAMGPTSEVLSPANLAAAFGTTTVTA